MDRLEFGLDIFGQEIKAGDAPMGFVNYTDSTKLRRMLDLAMLTTLTDKQRSIVKMFYFDNMSVTEIAFVLQLNKSTVSRHLSKARAKLKNYIRYGNFRLWDK